MCWVASGFTLWWMKCLIFFFLIDKEIKKLKLLAYLKMSSAQFICISSDEDDDYVPPSILNLSTQQRVKSKESPELSKIGNLFVNFSLNS